MINPNAVKQIKELRIENGTIQLKLTAVSDWLTHNTKHPDFREKIAERNALSSRLYINKAKLENLRQRRPVLGDPIGEWKEAHDSAGKKNNRN